MKRVGSTGIQGAALALGLHGVLLGYLLLSDVPPSPATRKRPPVRMQLVSRSKPRPPAPPVEVKQTPPPVPVVRSEPKKARPRRKRRARQPRPEPRPATEPRQETSPRKARRKFAVSLDVTVPSGGVAVPASSRGRSGVGLVQPGGTGGADAPRTGPAVATTGSAQGRGAQKARVVTTAPRLLSAPSNDRLRSIYPMEARRAGLEGNVPMKILVSVKGKVARVRILRRAGNGFDEAARKLARELRFAAGTRDGKPVAVWIPWTYKFRLNG